MGRSERSRGSMSDTRKYRRFTSLRGPKSMAGQCREHEIADSLLRKWREQFLAAGKVLLSAPAPVSDVSAPASDAASDTGQRTLWTSPSTALRGADRRGSVPANGLACRGTISRSRHGSPGNQPPAPARGSRASTATGRSCRHPVRQGAMSNGRVWGGQDRSRRDRHRLLAETAP